MRKIVETTSTLALWAVFIIGSTFALKDFLVFNSDTTELMHLHLNIVVWAPFYAALIYGGMLLSVRLSKFSLVKKTLASEHSVQWTTEEFVAAQSGKVVDLHFPAPGLACQVVAREELISALRSENQVMEIKVASTSTQKSSWIFKKVAARSLVMAIVFLPNALRDYVGRHF